MTTNACHKKFTAEQFRLQVIAQMCLGFDYLKHYLMENVKQLYGSGEELAGPFSVKQYLHFMSKEKEWCNSIFLAGVSSCWGLRITVIRSDSCAEVQYRHSKLLCDVDIALMYKCKMATGHYWGVLRFDGQYCDSLKVVGAHGYKEPPKRKPELQEDFKLVKKTRLVELEQKEAILDQMIKQFKEKGLKVGKGIQISSGGKGDEGKSDDGKGDDGQGDKGKGEGLQL